MELWDLYTKDRERTGRTMVRGGGQPEGFYRTVVHICIFSRDGRMLIQQRQPFKSSWSNMWDVSVGGSAVAGDSSASAAARELREELGLEVDFSDRRPALTINFHGGFDDIYLVEQDVDIDRLALQYEEVQAARWATLGEILAMIDAGTFIPYHRSFMELLFSLRDHAGTHTREDDTTPTR